MPQARSLSFSKTTPALFREALGCFATGVSVMTALQGKEKTPVGVTISSFAGLSLKPPLVLFCLDEKSGSLPAFKPGVAFAVNILSETQKPLADFFSRAGKLNWKKISYTQQGGAPVLKDALATLLCTVERKLPGGDHHIIIGRVKKITVARGLQPLLHTQRRYWGLGKAKRV